MKKMKWFIILFFAASICLAQRYYDRRGVPDWKPDEEFSHDVFTFVRIHYSEGYGGYDGYGRGYGRGRGRRGDRWGSWATD